MKPRHKIHALTLEFAQLCNTPKAKCSYTIVDGTKRDRLAKLITCKRCLRGWQALVA